MDYRESLDYIHSLLRFGIRPGLERVTHLLGKLGHPEKGLKILHVAGTNGKGSVCVMLSSILREAGYKTGLFISPYVVDFRERIQINGAYIGEEELAEAATKLRPLAEEMEKQDIAPTEFEFITALALSHFANAGCEAVVLETGLGGRFDSTNIVEKPLVSVITAISLDHTAVLGGTVEEIAFEKCGILKPDCPAVTTPYQKAEALAVIRRSAESRGCPLTIPDIGNLVVEESDLFGSRFTYGGRDYILSLAGRHQIENAVTAIEGIRASGLSVTENQIAAGLHFTTFPARLELLCKRPLVLLDGAHNPAGATVLAEALLPYAGRVTAIAGMMRDKDYQGILKILGPVCSKIITVTVAGNDRSLTAEELAEAARSYCKQVVPAVSYQSALNAAAYQSYQNPILICGSLYLAGDIRETAKNFFRKR